MEYLIFILIALTIVTASMDWKPKAPVYSREVDVVKNSNVTFQTLDNDSIQKQH